MPVDVYIVECVRTPIGRGKPDGSLHHVHPIHLLAHTLHELITRCGISKGDVEDVVTGVVTPVNQQGANIGRLAALQAGFPVHVPSVQLNRMCGSGQQAIHFAAQSILAGDMDMVIACGVEMMSVVKMGSDAEQGLFDGKKSDFAANFPYKLLHQGVSAELVADKYGVSREECDHFAVESHRRAAIAIKNGYWKASLVHVPVEFKTPEGQIKKFIFSQDETIRPSTNLSTLAKLPPVFKKNGGVVTAGNASQVVDGAAAVLLCSGKKADQLGLRKRARIVARVVVGSDPALMLDGVIPATQMVLKKAALSIQDIGFFEVNEAFASVVLAWMKTLKVDPVKVNPNGGAIAHGHPLGATGCILATKIVNELERSGHRYALQTMCIGHGMATATIYENCNYSAAALSKSKL